MNSAYGMLKNQAPRVIRSSACGGLEMEERLPGQGVTGVPETFVHSPEGMEKAEECLAQRSFSPPSFQEGSRDGLLVRCQGYRFSL